MPPTGEIVNPAPLTGAELRRIMLKDTEDMMMRDCVLNGVTAFGQVSYELTIKMHFQNLSFPSSSVRVVSHPPTSAELAANPLRSHIEGEPPLDHGEGETVALERVREIESPTQARVEFEIPVPLVTPGKSATMKMDKPGEAITEKTAKYPKDSVTPGNKKDRNLKEETEREFAEKKRKRGK